MKLKNKRTGQVGNFIINKDHFECVDLDYVPEYRNLAELNEEWEDYKEKEYFYLDMDGDIRHTTNQAIVMYSREIGNYFETKEKAEKAAEKVKTLTKLCKKGFEFNGVEMFGSGLIRIEASIPINEKTTLQERSDITDSLYLLFGGEE